MSNRELGKRLVQLCRDGNNLESVRTLYGEDIVSVEAADGGFPRVTRGKQAVIEKNERWHREQEIHEHRVDGPYPHGDDKFAVRFGYDVTQKASGQRFQLDEIGVFTVADGKIVKEEFFYDMG